MTGGGKKPDPVFVHYGFDGGVSSSAIVDISDEVHLAVGTTRGKCLLFSPRTHLCEATVHEDPNVRSIVAVGQFSKDCIFVHIRYYAVLLLTVDSTAEVLNFRITRTIRTEFYGLCGAVCHKTCLFYPVFQDQKYLLNAITDTAEQKLQSVVDKSSLMAIAVSDDGFLACGFENGCLKIVDTENFAVTDEKKPFSDAILSCAVSGSKLAVSSIKSPIKLFTVNQKMIADEKVIPFLQKAGGCSTLSFSNCGRTLASGYWDGSVRVHSVKTGTIRVVLDFHSEVINCLHWNVIDSQRLLFICSKDAKLSIWNLYND